MRNLFLLVFLVSFCFFSCKKNTSTGNTESHNRVISENIIQETYPEVLSLDVQTVEVLDNWLGINIDEQLVLSKLGAPDSLGVDEYWDALGAYIQKWEYKKEGICLEMESNEQGSLKHIFSIMIKSPCKMKTQQVVGIGSLRDDIEKIYNSVIDRDNTCDSIIVVGSIYEGSIFYFKNNSVNQLFIGALAE